MPYFNHSMARSIHQSTGSNTKVSSERQTRSMPGSSHKGDTGPIHKSADPEKVSGYKLQMTKRKMLFMRSLLHAQVGQLMGSTAAYPIERNGRLFQTYKINYKSVRSENPEMKMYDAKNSQAPDTNLIVRIYSRSDHNPTTDLYLKIIWHLGRKHPYIIHTWEIFSDAKSVYVFQECANKGSLADYYAKDSIKPVNEKQAAFWAKQVFRALDFLGDQAIAHRDISPSHLMLVPTNTGELWLKLTGFGQAIIYWDVNTNDVNFCQCWPMPKEIPTNFQAPEVYGNPEKEQFDPIQADLWSYAANIFFILTKEYPYNVQHPSADISDEIMTNVKKLAKVGSDCKQFLSALLQGNSNDRMPFDFIETHRWFTSNTLAKSIKATAKEIKENAEKGKIARVSAFPSEMLKPKGEEPPVVAEPRPGDQSKILVEVKNSDGTVSSVDGLSKGGGASIGGASSKAGGSISGGSKSKSAQMSTGGKSISSAKSGSISAKPKSVSGTSKSGTSSVNGGSKSIGGGASASKVSSKSALGGGGKSQKSKSIGGSSSVGGGSISTKPKSVSGASKSGTSSVNGGSKSIGGGASASKVSSKSALGGKSEKSKSVGGTSKSGSSTSLSKR